MFDDFFRWWAQQLHSLVPARAGAGEDSDAVILRSRGGNGFDLMVLRRGRTQPAGRIALEPPGMAAARASVARVRQAGPLVLDLPSATVLEQTASYPAAAEPELSAVLGHEMDRLTPFRAEDVFWSWRIAGRDGPDGRLVVALSILPKLAAQPVLALLEAAGLHATALQARTPGGLTRRIGVLPPGTRRPGQRRAIRSAAWACAALSACVTAIPVVQQERALAAANGQLEALQPRIALVEALRRRLASASGGADTFAAESARTGNALATLAAVTAALPDDTYLTEFNLRDHKVTLTGRSAGAVRLIGLLSAEPGLANPAFAAPVVRLIGERGDQFTIRADLAP